MKTFTDFSTELLKLKTQLEGKQQEDIANVAGDGAVNMNPTGRAKKLIRQSELMKLLSGIETLVSCQALDLRHDNISHSKLISSPTKLMFRIIRQTIDKILIDRPIENDIETTAVELEEFIKLKKLKKFWIFN